MRAAVSAGRDDLLSAIDAAKILGLSADMVRLLAREGRLVTTAHTVRGQRLFRRSDVEDLAAERAGHPAHRHVVQFFDEDSALCVAVAGFAAESLRAGAPVALITTKVHQIDIRARLEILGIDLSAVSTSGQLQVHDAAACLATFLVDGVLDPQRFRVSMGAVLAEVSRPRARVRVFGEMVDLLCELGDHAAAAQLEGMWNELATDHSFTLLCGYRMRNFAQSGHANEFDSICGSHTHVVPAEGYAQGGCLEDGLRGIASLQQRAASLEGERAARLAVEERLTGAELARVEAEALLRRREGELAEQGVVLSGATRAKDELLAMLGHELRNPLAPIQTAIELMRLRGQTSREQVMLERQVGYLVRLVDDLLDISRLAHGKIDLRRRRVPLGEVVRAAVDAASPLLEQRHQKLEVEVPDDLVVDVDPDRMAQVVANLLTNAAKYSNPASLIQVRACATGGEVQLSVRDDGIGIAPDMAERVFDSFVQHGQTVERAGGGLGLGLAIVRGLTELHGGTAEVHSEGPGRGSEFRVTLPALVESAAAVRPASTHAPAASGPRRVLVVDDNEDLAALIGELLQLYGHAVELAHDGPSAVETAARFRPDVALLDIGLPVMDGYEVAARLRESSPDIRMVAISGYGQAADRRRSAEAGFAVHLVKPVDPVLLAAAVNDTGRDAPVA